VSSIDLSAALKDELPAITGITAEPASTDSRLNLRKAITDRLTGQSGISMNAMPPIAAAGVQLTKLVLFMVMASIVLLTLYLFVVDLRNGASLDGAYQSVIRQATVGFDFPDAVAIARLEKLLDTAMHAPDRQLSADELRDSLAIVSVIGRVPTTSDLQREDLKRCVPLPLAPADRTQLLSRCIDTLAVLQQGASNAAVNAEKLRTFTEFAKEVNEHRQTFRTFWLQLAQLILLNLLLPLLTALLGYIFGTTRTTP